MNPAWIRTFLLSVSALVACCLLPAVSADDAIEMTTDPFEVRFEELAEGVWLAQRPRPERQPVMGNGVIIINDDHVVVVDGAGSPLLAERVIAGIRRRRFDR